MFVHQDRLHPLGGQRTRIAAKTLCGLFADGQHRQTHLIGLDRHDIARFLTEEVQEQERLVGRQCLLQFWQFERSGPGREQVAVEGTAGPLLAVLLTDCLAGFRQLR